MGLQIEVDENKFADEDLDDEEIDAASNKPMQDIAMVGAPASIR